MLWRLDVQLGELLSRSSQPIAAQLKLAWWREALIGLDTKAAPAEPMLQSVQAHLLPSGISGEKLAALVDGWEHLLAEDMLQSTHLANYASARGATLFGLSAHLLGEEPIASLGAVGEGWALVDLARHASSTEEVEAALAMARIRLSEIPKLWPRALRPLGMLAMLARRDASAGPQRVGSPGRMFRMLVHRISGR